MLKKGDSVVVTGDTDMVRHRFPVGTVGTIVSNAEGRETARVAGSDGQTWWVGKNDLALVSPVVCDCCGVR